MNKYTIVRHVLLVSMIITLQGCIAVPSVQSPTVIDSSPTYNSPPITPTFIKATWIMPPTVIATLTDNQIQDRILGELSDQKDCQLPCWWGIVPDSLANYYYSVFLFSGEYSAISLRSYFFVRDGVVYKIQIIAEGISNPSAFPNIYGNFFPEKIMSLYGPPSRVLIDANVSGESRAILSYGMHFLYDQQGFLLGYSGIIPYQELTSRFCPTFGNGGDLNSSLVIIIQSPQDDLPSGQAPSLQEAAGITPQDLYNLYTEQKKPICFDTPTSLWQK
jgi:hypothetical protein